MKVNKTIDLPFHLSTLIHCNMIRPIINISRDRELKLYKSSVMH